MYIREIINLEPILVLNHWPAISQHLKLGEWHFVGSH
jgi:hypothetical protein